MQPRHASPGLFIRSGTFHTRGSAIGDGVALDGPVSRGEVPFEAVAACDLPLLPAPRETFLRAFLTRADATGYAAPRAGADLGWYGLARACRSGNRVGPLFAERPANVTRFFPALPAALPGKPLLPDLSGGNADAFAARHGMHGGFEPARMYSRPVPALPPGRIYGVTILELG